MKIKKIDKSSLLIALVIFNLGCNGTKDAYVQSTASPAQESLTGLKDTEQKETLTQEIINNDSFYTSNTHPHPDSIKKWNEQNHINITINSIKSNKNTSFFQINESTGKIHGCDYILFDGFINWNEEAKIVENNKNKFKILLPKLEKAWLGSKTITKSEEFPEGNQRYPSNGFFSYNDEYLVVVDGDTHSGTINIIYFFDKNGTLLNKIKLEKPLSVPSFDFNKDKTFFTLSSSVNPEYYIFFPDGKLLTKNNFNHITKDKGNSYNSPLVSKEGKIVMLRNNLTWIYKNNNLISKISELPIEILGESDLCIVYKKESVYSKKYKIQIVDYVKKLLLAESNELSIDKQIKLKLATN